MLLAELPRTMARIRRLVREHPQDRELQRLLHSLLTSMASDSIDEAEVATLLSRMEERCLQPARSAAEGRLFDGRGMGSTPAISAQNPMMAECRGCKSGKPSHRTGLRDSRSSFFSTTYDDNDYVGPQEQHARLSYSSCDSSECATGGGPRWARLPAAQPTTRLASGGCGDVSASPRGCEDPFALHARLDAVAGSEHRLGGRLSVEGEEGASAGLVAPKRAAAMEHPPSPSRPATAAVESARVMRGLSDAAHLRRQHWQDLEIEAARKTHAASVDKLRKRHHAERHKVRAETSRLAHALMPPTRWHWLADRPPARRPALVLSHPPTHLPAHSGARRPAPPQQTIATLERELNTERLRSAEQLAAVTEARKADEKRWRAELERLASRLAETSSRLWRAESRLAAADARQRVNCASACEVAEVQRRFADEMEAAISAHQKELDTRGRATAASVAGMEERAARRVGEVEARWAETVRAEVESARRREADLAAQLDAALARQAEAEQRASAAEGEARRADARAAEMAATARAAAMGSARGRHAATGGVSDSDAVRVMQLEERLAAAEVEAQRSAEAARLANAARVAAEEAAHSARAEGRSQAMEQAVEQALLAARAELAEARSRDGGQAPQPVVAEALASARARVEAAEAMAGRAVGAAERADARAAQVHAAADERVESAAVEAAGAAIGALQQALEHAASAATDAAPGGAAINVTHVMRAVAAAWPPAAAKASASSPLHRRVELALVALLQAAVMPCTSAGSHERGGANIGAVEAARVEGIAVGRAQARAAMSGDVEAAVRAQLAAAVEAELALRLVDDAHDGAADAAACIGAGSDSPGGGSVGAVQATIGAMQRQLRAARQAVKTGDAAALYRLQRELPEVSHSILMAIQTEADRRLAAGYTEHSSAAPPSLLSSGAAESAPGGSETLIRRPTDERSERRRLEGLIRAAERTSRERDEQLDALHAMNEGLRLKAEGVELGLTALEMEKRALVQRNSELQAQLDDATYRHRSPMIASAPPPLPPPSLTELPWRPSEVSPPTVAAPSASECAAVDAIEWIESVTGIVRPNQNSGLAVWLKSGVVLCELINQVGVPASPRCSARNPSLHQASRAPFERGACT